MCFSKIHICYWAHTYQWCVVWRGGHIIDQHELEDPEGQNDCDAETDLLPCVSWKQEDEEDDEGEKDAWNEECHHVEQRLPFELQNEFDTGKWNSINDIIPSDSLEI